MNQFPPYIEVSQLEERKEQATLRLQALIRQEIHDLLLKGDERDYFDLTKFGSMYVERDVEKVKHLLEPIVGELNALGWKTTTSYGGTALFVYVSQKPSNCWEDGFS